jgi:hypothetical protein
MESSSLSLRRIALNNLNKNEVDHNRAMSPAVKEYIDSQI